MNGVLLVCMGNVCRSPIAQVIIADLAHKAQLPRRWFIESAGVGAGRISSPVDPRARAALTRRGYSVGKVKSRSVVVKDFERFDLILAMDSANMRALRTLSPAEHEHKLRFFLEFAPELTENEVPDPYYGPPQGFERVVDLCEAAGQGLIRHMQAAV